MIVAYLLVEMNFSLQFGVKISSSYVLAKSKNRIHITYPTQTSSIYFTQNHLQKILFIRSCATPTINRH